MTIRLRAQGLVLNRGGRRVLDVDSLDLEGPGIVLLCGASGGGKSTLLRALTGVVDLATEPKPMWTLPEGASRPRIAYLPQDPLDGLLAFDAESEFELRLQTLGRARADAQREAARRVAELGLAGRERLPFHELSGGELKRTALHAIQTNDPHVLLLDEPLNHLDDGWRARIQDQILDAAATCLVVVSSHDVDAWLPLATSVLVLRDGRCVFQDTSAAFAASRASFPEIREPLHEPRYPHPHYEEDTALHVRDLSLRRGQLLLRGAHLRLPCGVHAIVGPNGGGKSTLLRALAGLEPPEEGSVHLDGIDVRVRTGAERAERIAYHFEAPGRFFFHPTLRGDLQFQPSNAGAPPVAAEARARSAAHLLNVTELLERHPQSLSGGQQERGAIAALEAAEARLILLDEPTNGLDQNGWDDLLAFLDRHRRRACIVLATHEPDLVRVADTVHLVDGTRLRAVRLGGASALVEVSPRRRS